MSEQEGTGGIWEGSQIPGLGVCGDSYATGQDENTEGRGSSECYFVYGTELDSRFAGFEVSVGLPD